MTAEGPTGATTLAAQLRKIAQGRDSLDVAKLQFIDLQDIKSAYGDRWADNEARILDTAEGFLRRRADPADLLIKAGDGFLVVFGGASGMAAQAAAGSLSHGLNEFFLGEIMEAPPPRFGAVARSMPVKELAKSLGETLGETPLAAAPQPAPTEQAGLPQVDWRFQPVWDVKRETLSTWYVAPYSTLTHERLTGYQFEGAPAGMAQFVAIDEASLLVSERALQSMIAAGKQALVGSSIHVTSLTNLASRTRLFAALDRLNREYFRYRIFKIAGIAPGFPSLYLNEIVGALRTKAPNVALGAAWDEPEFGKLLQSGPVAVGVSLPKSVVGPTPVVPVQTLLRKLAGDIQSAHGAHMRFFVEGQIPKDLALRLSESGVDNISSPRIWPASGAPDGMQKWPRSRFAE